MGLTLTKEIEKTLEEVWDEYMREHMTMRMIALRGIRHNLAMCHEDLDNGIPEETVRNRYESIKHALSRI